MNLAALAWIMHQTCFHGVYGIRLGPVGVFDDVLGVGDGGQLLDGVQGCERRTAIYHLVEDAAQRPDITSSSKAHLLPVVAAVVAVFLGHRSNSLGSHVVDLRHKHIETSNSQTTKS